MSVGKKVLPAFVLVNNQSLAGSFSSNPTSIEHYDRACITIVCTGVPTGTVTIQGSNDYQSANLGSVPVVNPPNWFDLPLNLTALTGAPQNYVIDITETSFRFFRINYVFVAGAGNMTAVISAKES